MAVTLIEAAKQVTNEVQQAVIETFAMSTDLLAVLPFQEIPGRSLTYNQEETLPGVAFRSVNGSYPESTGIVNPIVEQLVIAGGDMDVDKFIDKTMGAGHRSVQEALKIKASGHEISHKFIKGDSASNANEFDGLQTRLTGAQVIDNGAGSGGTALSYAPRAAKDTLDHQHSRAPGASAPGPVYLGPIPLVTKYLARDGESRSRALHRSG